MVSYYNSLANVYGTLKIHYVKNQVGNKTPKKITNIILLLPLFYYLLLIEHEEIQIKKSRHREGSRSL